METTEVVDLLQTLTGEPVPSAKRLEGIAVPIGEGSAGLGYSQFNELLLLGGLDRVTQAFFGYLVTGTPNYQDGLAFHSQGDLEAGIQRFRKTALLVYGNVKFAFKSLSKDAELLRSDFRRLQRRSADGFEARHEPLLPVAEIPPEEAYLTGYLIESELRKRLQADPNDADAGELERRRTEVVRSALRNQAAYLASDHLDVYVATSMRTRHEFASVARTVREIFDDPVLTPLRLRWFDPTQAYCTNRIDKGLAEALMLKRATCTIYLAQETDTLGKDSELASTLAQGKPVIAYVPRVDEAYLAAYFASLTDTDSTKTLAEHLMEQLRLYEPGAAWSDEEVRQWCRAPLEAPVAELRQRVSQKIREHHETRARTLKEVHPLGIQVNLGTGVANGVLVARTAKDCARLVYGIMTGTLEFDLDESPQYSALRERISGSIFRVMTSDAMLTNTFWNFYLNQAE